ncbi:MAG TPA: VWA domain-containing protein [Gemmataceae bacterium]|jgi:Ca-activated chloride channel family protein|nr:VWA domain-containing protein [Gemmataceae bacterium]
MAVEFAEPAFLWLLPVVVLLGLWRWRSRPAALRVPTLSLFNGIPRARGPRIVGEVFRLTAVTAVILALAGPRTPDLKTRIPAEGIAIVFVLDTSGSMQDATFLWDGTSAPVSRAEAARRAFRLFIAGGDGPDGVHFDGRSTERGTDAVGLVTFTNLPHPVCPPTLNHSVLLNILDRVPPPTARDTGTNIGDALVEGIQRLDKSGGKTKVLILLSDGEHNIDFDDEGRQPLKPRPAASLAANLGVKIYTIDTGGDPPADDPDAAQRRLDGRAVNERIAEMTGGKAFAANDGGQLLDVCRQIDGLERQAVMAPVYRRYHEYQPWLALVAAGLAALAYLLEQTVWRRVP